MIDQITVIGLVEYEFDCEEVELYQDKIANLREKRHHLLCLSDEELRGLRLQDSYIK
ncbi:hypothetical protein HAX54_039536, partial [Datura stramonium]|nr:hypothetical protein [Datura stramonium]